MSRRHGNRALGGQGAVVVAGSVAVRRLWIWGGSVFTLGFLATIGLQSVNALTFRVETVSQSLPAAGIEVVDISTDGTIDVVSGDVDEITVTSDVHHGLVRSRHSVVVDGSTLRVRTRCSFLSSNCSSDEHLVVPRGVAVHLRADNGRIGVDGVDGGVDVATDNGSIELDDIGGPVVARSDNGFIHATGLRGPSAIGASDNGSVRLTFATPPVTASASSDNGDAEIVVPDDETTYLVDVASDNGGEDVAVRTDPHASRTLTAHSDNGHSAVRYPTTG